MNNKILLSIGILFVLLLFCGVRADDSSFVIIIDNSTPCQNNSDTTPPIITAMYMYPWIIQNSINQANLYVFAEDNESGLWDHCQVHIYDPTGAPLTSENGFSYAWINTADPSPNPRTCGGLLQINQSNNNNISGFFNLTVTVFNGDNENQSIPICSHLGTSKSISFWYSNNNQWPSSMHNLTNWTVINNSLPNLSIAYYPDKFLFNGDINLDNPSLVFQGTLKVANINFLSDSRSVWIFGRATLDDLYSKLAGNSIVITQNGIDDPLISYLGNIEQDEIQDFNFSISVNKSGYYEGRLIVKFDKMFNVFPVVAQIPFILNITENGSQRYFPKIRLTPSAFYQSINLIPQNISYNLSIQNVDDIPINISFIPSDMQYVSLSPNNVILQPGSNINISITMNVPDYCGQFVPFIQLTANANERTQLIYDYQLPTNTMEAIGHCLEYGIVPPYGVLGPKLITPPISGEYIISVDNQTNLTPIFSGNHIVQIRLNNFTLIEFPWSWTDGNIDMSQLNIYEITNNKSSILISGLNLSENIIKTVYLKKIANTSKLCIKDAEVSSLSEISINCNGSDERLIECNNSIQYGYICSLINQSFSGSCNSTINQTNSSGSGGLEGSDCGWAQMIPYYKVTGLKHSGITEYYLYCGDIVCNNGESCSSCSNDCGFCPTSSSSSHSSGGLGFIVPTIKLNATNTSSLNISNAPTISSSNKVNAIEEKKMDALTSKDEPRAIDAKLNEITGAVVGNHKLEGNKYILILTIFLLILAVSLFYWKTKKK